MLRRALMVGVCLAAAMLGADDDSDSQAVYTMTNDAGGNRVMIFARQEDGTLTPGPSVATGGIGTGTGLGSQGALALSRSKRWLVAVNAGSDEISVLRVSDGDLSLVSKVSSGGRMPVSVTVSGRMVYVLNAGAPASISGFWLGNDGNLTPIPNSTRTLSAQSPNPAQVQFSNDGDQLVVTEKDTNLIDVFPVTPAGTPGMRTSVPSHGITPFGFDFGRGDQMFVTEAFGGADGASAVTSYRLGANNMLRTVSGSAKTNQTSACWMVVHRSGRFGYSSNTGSRTVSLFRIGRGGGLTLVSNDARTPAGATGDATISGDGDFLHVLTSRASTIVTFRIGVDGTLKEVNSISAPAGSVGLVAR